MSSLIRLASYRIPCFFRAFLCFLCDTEKFLFLRSEQSIIPQTARQPCLCSVKYDAMRLQLAAIHRKVPHPVSFLNIDRDPQCLSKLPGGQYHVFSVFTAKVTRACICLLATVKMAGLALPSVCLKYPLMV